MTPDELHNLLKRQIKRHFGSMDRAPDGLADFLRDVNDAYVQADTDRKMLERSLELSSDDLLKANADMRAVINLLPDLFFRIDANGVILDCSTGNLDLLLYPAERLIGRLIQSVPDRDARDAFLNALGEVEKKGVTAVAEYKLTLKGSPRYFETTIIPLDLHTRVVFVRDVTSRKQSETERSHLVTAIEQAAESVVICDTRGKILYTNPAFERITGYSREEVMGQNPRILKSGKQSPEFYKQMWDTVLSGTPWQGHFTNRRKDGTFFEIDSTISPIRDTKGEIINFVLVGHDVTREVELEERLRQSQKMEAVGRLAGGIAHDFNNLLTAVMGNAELVLNTLSETDPIRDDMLEIKRSASRAASLTSQLLAFGRKQVLNPKVVNLNAVILEMSRLLRRVIGENIEMDVDLAQDLWSIRADPVQIEQVVMNLALNSRDAMPRGGKLGIRTRNQSVGEPLGDLQPGDYAVLTVSDTGTGMDDRTKSHLFEPFFTTKGVGKGTGLGLATSYGTIKQSGGTISVESSIDRGTTFTIYLPRVERGVAEAKAPATTPQTLQGAETIMLVEDEAQVRRLATTILQRFGYKVIEAKNGLEAIDFASKFDGTIHLLLTDVVMPGMSGDTVARRICETRPGTKVLFMSGHPESMVSHMGVIASDGRFIKKPFTGADLARRVREVIDK